MLRNLRKDEIWYRDEDSYPHYLCKVVGCRTMISHPKRICGNHPRIYKYWQYKGYLFAHWLDRKMIGYTRGYLWNLKCGVRAWITGRLMDFFWGWMEKRESRHIIHEKWTLAKAEGRIN